MKINKINLFLIVIAFLLNSGIFAMETNKKQTIESTEIELPAGAETKPKSPESLINQCLMMVENHLVDANCDELKKFFLETCSTVEEVLQIKLVDILWAKALAKNNPNTLIVLAEISLIKKNEEDIKNKAKQGGIHDTNWNLRFEKCLDTIFQGAIFQDKVNIRPITIALRLNCDLLIKFLFKNYIVVSRAEVMLIFKQLLQMKWFDKVRKFYYMLYEIDKNYFPHREASYKQMFLAYPDLFQAIYKFNNVVPKIGTFNITAPRSNVLPPNLSEQVLNGNTKVLRILQDSGENLSNVCIIFDGKYCEYSAKRFNPDYGKKEAQPVHYIPLIFIACKNGFKEMLDFLLSVDVDLNVEAYGKTALTLAIESQNLKMVDCLLEHGASIDKYALHAACATNNLELVKLLVSKDAYINLKLESDYCEQIETLDETAPLEQLWASYAENHIRFDGKKVYEIANFLAENGANIDFDNLFCIWLSCPNYELFVWLLDHGLDPNHKIGKDDSFLSEMVEFYGDTHDSARKKSLTIFKCIQLLVAKGASKEELFKLFESTKKQFETKQDGEDLTFAYEQSVLGVYVKYLKNKTQKEKKVL